MISLNIIFTCDNFALFKKWAEYRYLYSIRFGFGLCQLLQLVCTCQYNISNFRKELINIYSIHINWTKYYDLFQFSSLNYPTFFLMERLRLSLYIHFSLNVTSIIIDIPFDVVYVEYTSFIKHNILIALYWTSVVKEKWSFICSFHVTLVHSSLLLNILSSFVYETT
jgi:hypothetical protein